MGIGILFNLPIERQWPGFPHPPLGNALLYFTAVCVFPGSASNDLLIKVYFITKRKKMEDLGIKIII